MSLPPSGPLADFTHRLPSLFLLGLSKGLRRVSAQGPSHHCRLELVRAVVAQQAVQGPQPPTWSPGGPGSMTEG